jgi:hypothetical protein
LAFDWLLARSEVTGQIQSCRRQFKEGRTRNAPKVGAPLIFISLFLISRYPWSLVTSPNTKNEELAGAWIAAVKHLAAYKKTAKGE